MRKKKSKYLTRRNPFKILSGLIAMVVLKKVFKKSLDM